MTPEERNNRINAIMSSIEFTKKQIAQQEAIVKGLKGSGDKTKLIDGIQANVNNYKEGLKRLERQLEELRK